VLLIAITIAAGLAIYGWVSGLISAGTSSKLTGSTPLTLTLASVTNTAKSGQQSPIQVTVTITNQGDHDVSLSSNNIEIVSAAGEVCTVAPFSSNINIAAGSTQTVTITFTPHSGDLSNTFTLSIVGATDNANEPVIANSVSFTV